MLDGGETIGFEEGYNPARYATGEAGARVDEGAVKLHERSAGADAAICFLGTADAAGGDQRNRAAGGLAEIDEALRGPGR